MEFEYEFYTQLSISMVSIIYRNHSAHNANFAPVFFLIIFEQFSKKEIFLLLKG
jgi:hypothetical protein